MFRKLTKFDLPQIEAWWGPKPVPFVDCPDSAWIDYVTDNQNIVSFCSEADVNGQRQIACYSQTDIETVNNQKTGWIALVTAPKFCRQGFARDHFLQLKPILTELGVTCVIASIDQRNVASTALFTALGFADSGSADDDPNLRYFKIRL